MSIMRNVFLPNICQREVISVSQSVRNVVIKKQPSLPFGRHPTLCLQNIV